MSSVRLLGESHREIKMRYNIGTGAIGDFSTASALTETIYYNGVNRMANPKSTTKKRICAMDGCTQDVRAKGYCNKHYARLYRHGDPSVTKVASPGEPLSFVDKVCSGRLQSSDCIEWPFGKSNGYGDVWKERKKYPAHRLVLIKTVGDPLTDDMEAAHNCGNRGCVNPAHLRWATPKENQADRLIHGTENMGEKHGSSKLTRANVISIRRDDRRLRDIAQEYRVSRVTISSIKLRKTWSHVADE